MTTDECCKRAKLLQRERERENAKVLLANKKNTYKWKSQPTINRVKNSRDATYKHIIKVRREKRRGDERSRESTSTHKMIEIGEEDGIKRSATK